MSYPCWLQGHTVIAQGLQGGYKSQKIKFFPAKSMGGASWGPVVLERQLGMVVVQLFEGGGWNSSLGRETEAQSGVTLWEVPLCLSFPCLQPAVLCQEATGPVKVGCSLGRGGSGCLAMDPQCEGGGEQEGVWGHRGLYRGIWGILGL